MIVLLLRHGHDLPSSDGEAMLSSQGRAQVATTIDQAIAHGVDSFDLALCAQSRRALESLQVASDRITINHSMVSAAIDPDATAESLLEALFSQLECSEEATVLVVGHEPQLTSLLFLASGATPPPNPQRRDLLGRGEGALAELQVRDSQVMLDPDALVFLGERHLGQPHPAVVKPAILFS